MLESPNWDWESIVLGAVLTHASFFCFRSVLSSAGSMSTKMEIKGKGLLTWIVVAPLKTEDVLGFSFLPNICFPGGWKHSSHVLKQLFFFYCNALCQYKASQQSMKLDKWSWLDCNQSSTVSRRRIESRFILSYAFSKFTVNGCLRNKWPPEDLRIQRITQCPYRLVWPTKYPLLIPL